MPIPLGAKTPISLMELKEVATGPGPFGESGFIVPIFMPTPHACPWVSERSLRYAKHMKSATRSGKQVQSAEDKESVQCMPAPASACA